MKQPNVFASSATLLYVNELVLFNNQLSIFNNQLFCGE